MLRHVNAAQDLFINLSIDERLVYLLDYKVMMIDASERESEQRATKMPANEKLSRNCNEIVTLAT
jgi:hypothetical protein